MAETGRSLEWKVGLLLVTAAAVAIGFVFVLGGFSLGSGFTVFVDYDYVGNLQEGAPVKVSGIKVGRVEAVRFVGGREVDAKGRRVHVRVEAWIRDDVRQAVREDAEYFINTAGVLGEQYVEIVPGRDDQSPAVATGAVVRGSDPPRTDLVVSRLYEVLDGVSSVLREDRDAIRDLLRNSAGAVAEANRLLAAHRDDVGRLLGSSAALAQEATTTLSKVNTGLGNPAVVRSLLVDADALLVSAKTSLDTFTPAAVGLLTDAKRATSTLTAERIDRGLAAAEVAAAAANKAGGLIDNVDGLVTDVRAGKGTAGALLAREEVYADIRELIRDLKRNPWKFFWKE